MYNYIFSSSLTSNATFLTQSFTQKPIGEIPAGLSKDRPALSMIEAGLMSVT